MSEIASSPASDAPATRKVPTLPLAGPTGLAVLGVLALLAVWAFAIGHFGLVALGLPMVALTPVIYIMLIWISADKSV